jgi:uncharacterized protein YbjT (DUF2867 family)
MDVLVAGGHGKIGMRLLRLLARRGERAHGLIRNPDHAADLEAAGATPVVFDFETDSGLGERLADVDAVVFAAGAGPGSGPERKRTVDLGGATKLIDACKEAGVSRYAMLSAMGAGRESWPEQMRPYYEAKREADDALAASGLDYTIVRPGRLTDAAGTGRIEVGTPLERGGEITRDDVAAVLLAVLDEQASAGVTFDVLNGETPIATAVAGLAR